MDILLNLLGKSHDYKKLIPFLSIKEMEPNRSVTYCNYSETTGMPFKIQLNENNGIFQSMTITTQTNSDDTEYVYKNITKKDQVIPYLASKLTSSV